MRKGQHAADPLCVGGSQPLIRAQVRAVLERVLQRARRTEAHLDLAGSGDRDLEQSGGALGWDARGTVKTCGPAMAGLPEKIARGTARGTAVRYAPLAGQSSARLITCR